MFNTKCNCGRDSRYSHFVDGKEVYSCNKRIVCPTYEELDKEVRELRSENSKLKYSVQQLLTHTEILKESTKTPNKWDALR